MKLEEPDKGQAWIVAVAASLICMIVGGLSRGSGLLYVAIIATYGVSRKKAAQPFFFKDAIRCLAGKNFIYEAVLISFL